MKRTTGIVDSVRAFVLERGIATVRDYRDAHPRAHSVGAAFQHLANRGELDARNERGRGRLGVRKVYTAKLHRDSKPANEARP